MGGAGGVHDSSMIYSTLRIRPRETTNEVEANLAPDMGRVLVNESLSGITEEELRDDQQPDVFLAVQGLLQDVAAVAIRGKLDDTAAV